MDKERKFLVLVMLIVLLLVLGVTFFSTKDKATMNFERWSEQPYLVTQYKVGDDKLPHIHQIWCVDNVMKKQVADGAPFCYVEVIDDWMVE